MTTAVATPDPDDHDDELARKREQLMARRTKVMFLRNAGATWAAIAAETGVSEATVRADYRVVCRDINGEQPADVVARHRAVIFDIQRANYPAMMRGDKDAAATILRALDREAKLLGLDAPTRILATTSGEDFANEAARLIGRIQELDPNTLKELERGRHTEPTVIDAEPETPAAPVDGGAGQRRGPDQARGQGAVDAAPPAREPDGDDPGTGPGAPRDQQQLPRPARPAIDPAAWSNIDDDD